MARRESASLGVKLDESKQLADFRVVEPPRVSSAPVFPGRIHLALMAALLVLVGGAAAALGLDLLKPTLNDSHSLELLSGRPVLGSISLSKTDASRLVDRRDLQRFAAAAALLLVCQTAWLAWLAVRPVSI